MRKFLWDNLILIVSETKSKVDRTWKCKIPEYSMILEKSPRWRVAPERYRKFRNSLKEVFHRGRGRKIADTVTELNPKRQGWGNYFQFTQNKGMLQEIDGWLLPKDSLMQSGWLRYRFKVEQNNSNGKRRVRNRTYGAGVGGEFKKIS